MTDINIKKYNIKKYKSFLKNNKLYDEYMDYRQYNFGEKLYKKLILEHKKIVNSINKQIEDLKCCGNCGYENRNTKNNGGCFGCKDGRSGKTVYHGWKPKEVLCH